MKTKIFLFGREGKMVSCLKALLPTSPFQLTESLDQARGCIDFTAPEPFPSHLAAACASHLPLVIGTTGLTSAHHKAMEEAARSIPLFYAPNFSLGVALMARALKGLKKTVPFDTKISLEETHHCSKKDAPSGTALLLAKPLNLPPEEITSHRPDKTQFIHHVAFSFGSETLTLTHESFSRDVYALGALRALTFLLTKPCGLYTMEDLIDEIS